MGSCICVDPDGVVATCCHTLINFFERWSPYAVPKGPDVKEVIEDAERHERPWFFFPSKFAWQPSGRTHEGGAYPMLSFQADRLLDIAVVELGGSGVDRPLPFVRIARFPAEVGDKVRFAGFYDSGVLKDRDGYLRGWPMCKDEASVICSTPNGFLIDYPVRRGMSGSGVFNGEGGLVGIIVEYWSPEFAAKQVGIEKSLGLCANAHLLIPQYQKLRLEAEARAADGDLPWCTLT
jgi:hypothetical protein